MRKSTSYSYHWFVVSLRTFKATPSDRVEWIQWIKARTPLTSSYITSQWTNQTKSYPTKLSPNLNQRFSSSSSSSSSSSIRKWSGQFSEVVQTKPALLRSLSYRTQRKKIKTLLLLAFVGWVSLPLSFQQPLLPHIPNSHYLFSSIKFSPFSCSTYSTGTTRIPAAL